MEEFASLGVDVAITELDLRIRLPGDGKSLAAQAADYASVVRACRATPRCVGVTTWASPTTIRGSRLSFRAMARPCRSTRTTSPNPQSPP